MDQLTLNEARLGLNSIRYLLLAQLENSVSKTLSNIVL